MSGATYTFATASNLSCVFVIAISLSMAVLCTVSILDIKDKITALPLPDKSTQLVFNPTETDQLIDFVNESFVLIILYATFLATLSIVAMMVSSINLSFKLHREDDTELGAVCAVCHKAVRVYKVSKEDNLRVLRAHGGQCGNCKDRSKWIVGKLGSKV